MNAASGPLNTPVSTRRLNTAIGNLAEKIYKQFNACGAKKLAKQVVTLGSWEEEKLEAMRVIKGAKSKCEP